MDWLIPLAILVIAFILTVKMREVVRKNKALQMEKDVYMQIIREANIRGVPPKDLGDTPEEDE